MTTERQDIPSDFYQGDEKDIQITITDIDGNLKDLTGGELTYALIYDDGKNPYTVFLKSSADPLEIEIVTLGICVVHLVPSDTFNISGTFRHQLHLYDAAGKGGIVMTGKVVIFKSYARRPRKNVLPVYLEGG